VDDYAKYRPRYPEGLVDVLARHAGLTPASVVADVGAGTGIATALLLAHGCTVLAVVPNADMRAAAARALGPGAPVAAIWNERRRSTTPFLTGYDELLSRHGTDYREIAHSRRPIDVEQLATLFGGPAERYVLPNVQVLDWTGLRGRAMSASYVPLPGQPGHDALFAGLRALYDRCQEHGVVRIEYETEIYVVTLPV
jgi:hypothetical protein